MQPLPHGAWSIDLQAFADLVIACRQLVPGCTVASGGAERRTHAGYKCGPALRWLTNARTESRLARRRDVLPNRVAVQPKTLGNRAQRPTGRPMLKDLHHIRHVQAPSIHRPPHLTRSGLMVPGPAHTTRVMN